MNRDTTAFLQRVRDAEDPTRADEERVRRALSAAVVAGVAPSAGHAKADGAGFSERLLKLGAGGNKLNWLAVGVAAALGTGDLAPPPPRDVAGVSTPRQAELRPREPARERERQQEPSDPTPLPKPETSRQPLPARQRQKKPFPEPARQAEEVGLRRELELLRRVQAALKAEDGAAALQALDSHVTTDTSLLAERQAARILALCALGRLAEARHAAQRFQEEHPHSLQIEVVKSSCANQ